MPTVDFIPGPLSSQVGREQAEVVLRKHPAIQKGAAYAMEQLNGQWVAAIVQDEEEKKEDKDKAEEKQEKDAATKQAGPFPPGGDEPSDQADSAGGDDDEGGESGPPAPKPEGGDDDESGPPKSKGEGEGGKGGELHKVLHMLTQIFDALGLGGDMMGPGDPGDMGPGGPGGPPPPGGGPPGMVQKPGEQHVIHERVTKPGETPPGGTPIGTPAFANVREDHPFRAVAGKVASIPVVSELEGDSLEDAYAHLASLASEINYRVSNLEEIQGENGERLARAVLTRL